MTYTYTSNFPIGNAAPITHNISNSIPAGLIFTFFGFIALLVIWSVIWKALALWKSARRGETAWFVIFLIINTAGILEIIYLLMNREVKTASPSTPTTSTPTPSTPASPQA